MGIWFTSGMAWPENMGLMDQCHTAIHWTFSSIDSRGHLRSDNGFDGSWWNVDINAVWNIYWFIS